jgi:hypothetical protein
MSQNCLIPSAADPGPEAEPSRWVRDLFTGELKQVPAGRGGRQIIFRGSTPPNYDPNPVGCDPWRGKDKVCRPLSLKPEEVTPERIEQENAEAAKHGTGAWYDAEGECHIGSRGSRRREMARPKLRSGIRLSHQDNDAGYGDRAGR